jgi:hypothetical protein
MEVLYRKNVKQGKIFDIFVNVGKFFFLQKLYESYVRNAGILSFLRYRTSDIG